MRPAPVLVLCLGNDLRRDDGVGWRVAEALERDPPPGAAVRKSALAGLHLLDDLEGQERVVLVDAIRTARSPAGTVMRFPMGALRSARGASPHNMGLPAVLEMARQLGVAVPRRMEVVAVEVEDMHTLQEGLGEIVAAALPRAIAVARQAVADLLAQGDGQD